MMQKNWIDEKMMVMRMLAAALLLSVVIYGIVGYVVVVQGGFKPAMPDFPLIKLVLAGLSPVVIILSFVLRSVFLRAAITPQQSASMQPPDSSVAPEHQAVFARFFIAHIVPLVLCESVAVFGLVILFLTGDTTFFIGLLIVSALFILFHMPRKQKLLELIKEHDMKKSMGMPEKLG